MFVALNRNGDPGNGKQIVSINNRGGFRTNSFEGSFVPTAWNHVVCTYDGKDPYDVRSYAIYVNGRSLDLIANGQNGGQTKNNGLGFDSSISRNVKNFFIGAAERGAGLQHGPLGRRRRRTLWRAGTRYSGSAHVRRRLSAHGQSRGRLSL